MCEIAMRSNQLRNTFQRSNMLDEWVRTGGNTEDDIECKRLCFVHKGAGYSSIKSVYQCDCTKKNVLVDGSLSNNDTAQGTCTSVCGKEQGAGAFTGSWSNFKSCNCNDPWPHKFGSESDPPEQLRFWLENKCSDLRANQNTSWHVSSEKNLVWLDSKKKPWCVRPSTKTFRNSSMQFTFMLDQNCDHPDVLKVDRF